MRQESLRPYIYVFFILSGMTGLIYQIVWFKYLSLFLGNTTYAQVIVLSTFLGGLSIGNYLFGKRSDMMKKPVFVYGVIEILIGFYCLLYPVLVLFSENIFINVVNIDLIYENLTIYLLIKFLISSSLLLIPTILMGGTLPILTKFFTEKIQNIRKENATLYFLNSFGAVVGIYFAGFVLIRHFGLEVTIYIAGVINILIGGFSIFLNSLITPADKIEVNLQESEPKNLNQYEITKERFYLLVAISGLSGFTSFMYEILWTRVLINIFGSSTYSFSLMLMAFISGITIGSLIVSSNFISKLNRIRILSYAQLSIALGILLCLYIFESIPFEFWKIGNLFNKTEAAFGFFLSIEFLITFLLMFIPTIFMGMSLPLIVELISTSKNLVGYSVGLVFSVNTLGTVLGSIFTGLLLIPLIGVNNSFKVGIILNLIIVSSLYFVFREQLKSFDRNYKPVFILSVLILFLFIPDWNKTLMTSGVYRRLGEASPKTFNDYKKFVSQRKILFFKDGTNANVTVLQTTDTLQQRILLLNGKAEASSHGDMPTQLLLSHIPLFLHPEAKNIFIIGFASGTTVGAALSHNEVKNVMCAEITKEMLDASKFFTKENENCINDPRLKILIEDAQSVLKLSKEKFDLIISEPSNPWISGVGSLFSKEYFERCKNSLTENGLMAQWFQIYEMDDEIFSMVVRTFYSVFPFVQLWGGSNGDVILIGSLKKIEPDFNKMLTKIEQPRVKNNLSKIEINNLFTLLTTQLQSEEGTFVLSGNGKINSEIKPVLEFIAPISFFKGTSSTIAYKNDEKFDTLNQNLIVKQFVKQYKPDFNEIKNAIEYHINKTNNYRFAYSLANYLLETYGENNWVFETKAQLEEKLGIIKIDISDLEKALNQLPDAKALKRFYSNQMLIKTLNSSSFMRIYSLENIEKIYLQTLSTDTVKLISSYQTLAFSFLKNSEPTKALKYCELIENIITKNPSYVEKINLSDYFFVYANVGFLLNKYDKVIEKFISLINYNPNYELKPYLSKKIEWYVKEMRKRS